MKVFLRFLREYPKESVLAPLFKLLEACFDLFVPLVVAMLIDKGIGEENTTLSVILTLVLCGLAVVGLTCAIIAQYFSAKAACGSAARLRGDLFAHMQSFSYADTDKIGVSTMVTRLTSDINQVQGGVNITLRLLLRSPVIVLGAMIMAFTISPSLALIFAVTIPLLAVVVFGIILGGIPLYRRVQSKLDGVTGAVRENLNGARVIRAFGKEGEEVESFRRVNREETALQNTAGKLSGLMNPLTYLIINLATVLLIYMGALKVDVGGISQGQLVALINYMLQILVELVKLANSIFMVTKAVACGNRIGAVLDMKTGLDVQASEVLSNDEDAPAVAFCGVSLTYSGAGAPSLSGVDFAVNRGERVGIIGGTGSGKSSLVNLIPRFYDATEGDVFVNGINVRSMDEERLRSVIRIVPQKAVLFSGTVRSNLQWGKNDASDEEMLEALRMADAEGFVLEKGGLDAKVEQGGKNFSGGQRQCLTIARAVVGIPEILILDDSFSALDFLTDRKIRNALDALDYHPTVFIISQRTSSIRRCDKIICLDDGEVRGIGTHDELVESCGIYREIHMSQFSGGDAK